jgi:glutathione S-transferase
VDYARVEDAKGKGGLRLALTMGVPGPWSQAAKYIFEYKAIPFLAVGQMGGRENPELFEWTGHRNAPVAVYEEERPRAGWHEIIMLAERLAPEPGLLPTSVQARAEMFGLITEIASEGGFAWLRRLRLIDILYGAADEPKARLGPDILANRYGHAPGAAAAAEEDCARILAMLSDRLRDQETQGSDYFVGNDFTAADLYWACFSQLLVPMGADMNPMRPLLRTAYEAPASLSVDPILIAHRDRVYDRHLSLPLDF